MLIKNIQNYIFGFEIPVGLLLVSEGLRHYWGCVTMFLQAYNNLRPSDTSRRPTGLSKPKIYENIYFGRNLTPTGLVVLKNDYIVLVFFSVCRGLISYLLHGRAWQDMASFGKKCPASIAGHRTALFVSIDWERDSSVSAMKIQGGMIEKSTEKLHTEDFQVK